MDQGWLLDQGELLDLDQADYWISASYWTRTWAGYLTETGLVTGPGPGLVTSSELIAELEPGHGNRPGSIL